MRVVAESPSVIDFPQLKRSGISFGDYCFYYTYSLQSSSGTVSFLFIRCTRFRSICKRGKSLSGLLISTGKPFYICFHNKHSNPHGVLEVHLPSAEQERRDGATKCPDSGNDPKRERLHWQSSPISTVVGDASGWIRLQFVKHLHNKGATSHTSRVTSIACLSTLSGSTLGSFFNKYTMFLRISSKVRRSRDEQTDNRTVACRIGCSEDVVHSIVFASLSLRMQNRNVRVGHTQMCE